MVLQLCCAVEPQRRWFQRSFQAVPGHIGGAPFPPTLYLHTHAARSPPLLSPRCGPSRMHIGHSPEAELHSGMLVVCHLLLFNNCRNQSPDHGSFCKCATWVQNTFLEGWKGMCILNFHANCLVCLHSACIHVSSQHPWLSLGFPSTPAHGPLSVREVKPPWL